MILQNHRSNTANRADGVGTSVRPEAFSCLSWINGLARHGNGIQLENHNPHSAVRKPDISPNHVQSVHPLTHNRN